MTMRPVQPGGYVHLVASPAAASEVKKPAKEIVWHVLKD